MVDIVYDFESNDNFGYKFNATMPTWSYFSLSLSTPYNCTNGPIGLFRDITILLLLHSVFFINGGFIQGRIAISSVQTNESLNAFMSFNI